MIHNCGCHRLPPRISSGLLGFAGLPWLVLHAAQSRRGSQGMAKIENGHNGLGSWDVLSIFAHGIRRLSHTIMANHHRRSVERLGIGGTPRGRDFFMRGLMTASWRREDWPKKYTNSKSTREDFLSSAIQGNDCPIVPSFSSGLLLKSQSTNQAQSSHEASAECIRVGAYRNREHTLP